MRVTQVLYSGLGGHGSVVFSIIDGDVKKHTQNSLLFYGIEPIKYEYRQRCEQDKIPYAGILYGIKPFFIDWLRALIIILRQKPEFVLLHSISLSVLAPVLRLFGIKVIAIDHTPNSTKRPSEWTALKLALRLCNKVVYLTQSHEEEVRQKLGTSKKIHIINNGINTEVYQPSETPPAPPYTIMMQARFSHTKDFQTLIRAARLLKDSCQVPFLVRLAGDGDVKPVCEQLADELQLSGIVQFEGMLNERQILQLMAETHIYVHSTLSEAMSTSVMQALSCGKPVIASDIAGMDNLIQHGKTGLLFPVSNEQILADYLRQCLEGKIDTAALSGNARQFAVKRLSMERMFEEYWKLM
jgi:glycosyltransferase involved in cell wall biosynthesis